MTWESAAALAEIVGAVAVVISLVYLAVQVRMNSNQIAQNSEHIEATIYHSTNESFTNWFSLIAQDSETAEIWGKVLSNAELGEVEKIRAHALLTTLFLSYEANYQQERLGIVNRKSLEMPALKAIVSAPTVASWWEQQGPRIFTSEFRDAMAQVIEGTWSSNEKSA